MTNVKTGHSMANIQKRTLRFDTSVKSGLYDIDIDEMAATRIRTTLTLTPII